MPSLPKETAGKWGKKRKLTFKRGNLVTWGWDEADSGDEEEKDEEALLCLTALDYEANEVFDLKFSCFNDDYDDVDDLYHELYDSLVRAKKELKTNIVENDSLLQKLKWPKLVSWEIVNSK